ncbi:MAG: DUF72 domain-containing protein [Candidatus Sumerlaeota bacterium]
METTTQQDESPYLIGTSGWHYDDWVGPFYPGRFTRGQSELEYYARHFSCVEVNSTFYRLQRIGNAEKWCREVSKVRGDFRFSVKCWQGLTHDRPDTLPAEAILHIKDFCKVFIERKMYCGLLIQFPYSFHSGPRSREYLAKLLKIFADFSPVVEVRCEDWLREEWFFDLLRNHGATFCNIDQPEVRNCPRATSIVTAPLAYLRLHGRNTAQWFSESSNRNDRYDYLYGPDEIPEISELARSLALHAKSVVVTGNNHYRAQAVADALLLRQRLEGHAETAPHSLIETYPQLREVRFLDTLPQDAFEQPDLFQ